VSADDRLTTYYDGKCPMCSAIVRRVGDSDTRGQFELHDMHQERALPFARGAVEKAMHVVDGDGRVYRGADAILKIAEQFPRLTLLARVARFPPLAIFAPLVYRLVAANRRFIVGAASRLFWLKVTIIVAFCVGLTLSAHAWIGPRSFPLSPVVAALPTLDAFFAYALYGALFVLAALILVLPKPQLCIGGFLSIVVVFCALDQTRWQPWVFLYSFLLTTLACFSWDSEDAAGQKRTANIARLVMAGTYVFSGLQKLNANFIDVEFPWIVQPIVNLAPFAKEPLHAFGAAAPFVQAAFGFGLLTTRFRRVSLVLAVAMHLFILAMFGPLGLDWNNVVWPWTAAMAIIDVLLFASAQFSLRDALWSKGSYVHISALALFALLPLLSFFNLWDSYLSAALYSGNLNESVIYLSDAGARALPPTIAPFAVHVSNNTNVVNIQRWAIEDLNVMPYPETRVYKSVARSVCKSLADPTQLVLIVREQRLFLSRPESGYRCADL
jgi:predicted DCC family thiol-disulfide oxidoreductase YuxK